MLGLLISLLAAPAQAGAVWTLAMPLGVPQFTHHTPWRGVLYGALQAGALGAATWTTLEMRDAAIAGDIDRELPLRMASAAAVAGFTAVWTVSIIDGARQHALEQELNDASASDAAPGPFVLTARSPDEVLRAPALNLGGRPTDPGVWPAHLPAAPPAPSRR